MKLVVLMSFLLMLLLCSSGFEEYHGGITHTNQYSLNKAEKTSPEMMDYSELGANPRHDPRIPGYTNPPPSPQKS
ncbi:unnamed protein product [Thlaspi arvense]|uniref:Uncharacterized protein n=1 Tax=Thlaspi arvense TaxID=13288 RepID=A0AAU9RBZ1_THLAR|nr:unnamed protein product [Thlaspi arvense]